MILTNIIWLIKTDKRSNVEDPKNLKLYSLKHKTRMNKKAKTQIYTNELWNNRRSYAVKTNRIIMKTTYKRDAKKMFLENKGVCKKECSRNSSSIVVYSLIDHDYVHCCQQEKSIYKLKQFHHNFHVWLST